MSDVKVYNINGHNIVSLAPYIYNAKNFLFRDHPKYHPDSSNYLPYWDNEAKKAIEGFWGLDQKGKTNDDQFDPSLPGGWRFITPQHYWHINYCFLQHLPDPKSPPITQLADFRDIDTYWFYLYLIACGFSGFYGDENRNCHYLLKRYEDCLTSKNKHFTLTPKEKDLWDSIQDTIKKPDGSYKKYISPLYYLKSTFSKPMGSIIYENPMYNMADLEARGSGKTYRLIAVASQAFNFFGARTFDQYLKVKKGPTICVGSALSSKSGGLLKKFEFSQNMLVDNFGEWDDGVTFIPGYFHKETSGVISSGNEKNPYRHEFKAKKGKTWKKAGTFTSIVHQSYENNPEAFVGNRSILMIEDEFGLNENAEKCAHADNTVMKMSGVKMGIAVKSGTGGNILKVKGAKAIFYNPDDFGYLKLEDHWEHSSRGISVFIPSYYVDSSFRNENGNQNIIRAYQQEMHNRAKLINGASLTMLDGYIIDHPIVPSEMFLAPETNIFPVVLLREHKARLEAKNVFEKITSFGHLEYTDKTEKQVKWVVNTDRYRQPIKSYDLKSHDGNLGGCISVFQHPVDGIPDPTYNSSLYKIAVDPVRDDNGGISLYAISVYKGYTLAGWNDDFQNTIVAEYYGRLDDVDEMHEIAIKLCLYYNCKNLPETNIPDIIRYFKRKKKLHLFQAKPWDSISHAIASPSAKYDIGVDMSSPKLKIQGEQLINKWLNEKRGVDESGKNILTLHSINSLRLIDELLVYDRSKNTDGVITLMLIMFWIHQEELVPVQKKDKASHKSKVDEFFENNQKLKGLNNIMHNEYIS